MPEEFINTWMGDRHQDFVLGQHFSKKWSLERGGFPFCDATLPIRDSVPADCHALPSIGSRRKGDICSIQFHPRQSCSTASELAQAINSQICLTTAAPPIFETDRARPCFAGETSS